MTVSPREYPPEHFLDLETAHIEFITKVAKGEVKTYEAVVSDRVPSSNGKDGAPELAPVPTFFGRVVSVTGNIASSIVQRIKHVATGIFNFVSSPLYVVPAVLKLTASLVTGLVYALSIGNINLEPKKYLAEAVNSACVAAKRYISIVPGFVGAIAPGFAAKSELLYPAKIAAEKAIINIYEAYSNALSTLVELRTKSNQNMNEHDRIFKLVEETNTKLESLEIDPIEVARTKVAIAEKNLANHVANQGIFSFLPRNASKAMFELRVTQAENNLDRINANIKQVTEEQEQEKAKTVELINQYKTEIDANELIQMSTLKLMEQQTSIIAETESKVDELDFAMSNPRIGLKEKVEKTRAEAAKKAVKADTENVLLKLIKKMYYRL